MLNRLALLPALVCAVLCAACATTSGASHQTTDPTDMRSHLEERSRLQTLRQRMRQIVRRVAAEIPFTCDIAIAATNDPRVQSDLLAIAAGAGTYSYARCATTDPRVGLADLIVTYTSVLAIFERQAAAPGGAGMEPVIAVLRAADAEFRALGVESLPPDVLASVQAECAKLVEAEKASLRGATVSGTLQAAIGTGPAEFQIQSTFLNFNDNGLVEHALGEAHLMRLSLQEMGDCLSQLPVAFEYRARRAMLWAGMHPEVQAVRRELHEANTELKSLKEIAGLRAAAIKELESLPWTLGFGMVAALTVQGIVLGLLLRRR